MELKVHSSFVQNEANISIELKIVFLQIENEYTDIKRRVELETNEIRDKQQVRRSYTHDEDVHDNSIYNDDGFAIMMMVLE